MLFLEKEGLMFPERMKEMECQKGQVSFLSLRLREREVLQVWRQFDS